MTETRIREEICRLGRSLFERGLTPGSSGNISVKLDDGDVRLCGFRHAAISSGFLLSRNPVGFASGYHGLAGLPK